MADQSFIIDIVLTGAEGLRQGMTDAARSAGVAASAIDNLNKSFANFAQNGIRVDQSLKAINGSFANIRTGVSNVATSFNALGTAMQRTVRSTSLVAAAVGGAGVAVTAFALSGAKAADALNDQADAANMSADAYQAYQAAAAQAGISQQGFAAAMAKFNQQIETETRASAKSLVNFVDKLLEIKPPPGVLQIQKGFQDTERAIRAGVDTMKAKLKELGVSFDAKVIEQEMRKLATGTAASRAEFEKLTGQTLPSGNKALDDLRNSAESNRSVFQKLGIDLSKLTDPTTRTDEAMKLLADKFKDLPDGAEKTALAIQAFGRNAGPKLVNFLSQGREEVEKFLETFKKLGLNKDEIKLGDRLTGQLEAVSFALDKFKQKVSLAFAPAAFAGIEGISTLLSQNRDQILEFAKSLNDQALPYIQAFFDVLTNTENVTPAGEFMSGLKQKAIEFGTAVKGAVTDVIIPAFEVLMAVLNKVASVFNSVFGTNISGAMLGIAIVIGRITGVFGLLTTAIGFAASAFGLLVRSAGSIFTIFAAIANVVGWPATLGIALVALAANFESVRTVVDGLIRAFGALFNLDPSTSRLVLGIGAIGAALLLLRQRAGVASTALGALARTPLARALLLGAGALALLSKNSEAATDNVEKTGDATEKAADKATKAGKKFITVWEGGKMTKQEVPSPVSSGAVQIIKGATTETQKLGKATGDATTKAKEGEGQFGELGKTLRAASVGTFGEDITKQTETAFDGMLKSGEKLESDFKNLGLSGAIKENLKGDLPQFMHGFVDGLVDTVGGFFTKLGEIDQATSSWENFTAFIKKDFGDSVAQMETANTVFLDRIKAAWNKIKPTTPPPGAEPTISDTGDVTAATASAATEQAEALARQTQEQNAATQALQTYMSVRAQSAAADRAAVEAAQAATPIIPPEAATTAANVATETDKVASATATATANTGLLKNETAAVTAEVQKGTFAYTAREQALIQQTQTLNVNQDAAISKAGNLASGFSAITASDLAQPVEDMNIVLDAANVKTDELLAKLKAAAALSSASAGGAQATGFAGGGRVFGRGGIDNVPAWLSRDEFVMRTAAVRKYGLSFMNAINEGRLPGFALGGHVGAPRLAAGGQPKGKTYTEDQVFQILGKVLSGVEEGLKQIEKTWNDFANNLEKMAEEMGARSAEIASALTPENAMQSANELARMIEGFASGVVPSLKSAASALQKGADKAYESAKYVTFATGGQVHGTPGRDKVPAWLTDKEYVMNTGAVRKYGVGFMEAVNSGRLELGNFISEGLKIPRLAMGGQVSAPSGGSSPPPAGRPLVLQMADGSSYAGSMPTNTADSLERDVLRKRPAGRKQRWKR